MLNQVKYVNYTVENFVRLIIEKKLEKKKLISDIESNIKDRDIKNKIIQRINFAYKRISEPLDNETKFLLLIFPLGIANRLYPNNFFELEKNKKAGYMKKITEYYKYSAIGIIIYFL